MAAGRLRQPSDLLVLLLQEPGMLQLQGVQALLQELLLLLLAGRQRCCCSSSCMRDAGGTAQRSRPPQGGQQALSGRHLGLCRRGG